MILAEMIDIQSRQGRKLNKFSHQWFTNFSMNQNHLESLPKHRLLSQLQVFSSVGLWQGRRIYKFTDDAVETKLQKRCPTPSFLLWMIVPHFTVTEVTQEVTRNLISLPWRKFSLIYQQNNNYAHFKNQKIVTQRSDNCPVFSPFLPLHFPIIPVLFSSIFQFI